MSNATSNLIVDTVGKEGSLGVALVGASAIYEGTMIAHLQSDNSIVPGSTALSGDCIGVATHEAAATEMVEYETDRIFLFDNGTDTDACSASTPIGAPLYMVDNHTVADNDASGTRFKAGTFRGMQGTKVKVLIAPQQPATTAAGVSIADAGTFTATATVEASLQEIYQHLLSATTSIPLSLHQFREVDANGDVGNIAANGGLLASDTTPVLRGNAAETTEIYWAASNSDPISTQITLPADFNGAADVTVDLWVSSGTTDAATFTVETGWDGGALVSDSTSDTATKSATMHKLTVTIAAADIPDTAAMLTIALTPPAHTTDGIILSGVRVNYKRSLLAA